MKINLTSVFLFFFVLYLRLFLICFSFRTIPGLTDFFFIAVTGFTLILVTFLNISKESSGTGSLVKTLWQAFGLVKTGEQDVPGVTAVIRLNPDEIFINN